MEKEKMEFEELSKVSGGNWMDPLNEEEKKECKRLIEQLERRIHYYGPFHYSVTEARNELAAFEKKMEEKYGEQ